MVRKMNILEVTGEPILHGGQENFIYNILENIDNTEFKIDVLTPYWCCNDRFMNLVKRKGGMVYELNLDFKPWKSRRLIKKPILEFLKTKKYDVIHVHSGSISVLAYVAKAAQKVGIKKIIVHSHSTGEETLKHRLIQTAFSPILKNYPTYYLACSKEAGEMKFPKSVLNKLIIIKNGIKICDFSRKLSVREDLRCKYGIPSDAFVIGHVGRFTKEKNHSFLIDVFEKVQSSIPGSYLVLVGEGELEEEIKQRVTELNFKDYVVFTGVVDNPQDYYNVFDLFALPSLYEGFSFVSLEAQANGLPCIISTGVPEDVVLTKGVERIELDLSKWVKYIIDLKNKGDFCNSENSGLLQEFDICKTVDIINKLYMN